MEVFFGIDTLPGHFRHSVVTLGAFDGIHLGHSKIISQTIKIAKQRSAKSLVITFNPHPRSVLSEKLNKGIVPILTTPKEKMKLLEEKKIDGILFLETTAELLEISPENFIRDIIVNQISAKEIVIGYNFKFGKDRSGDTDFLEKLGEKFGFSTKIIDRIMNNEKTVSSTEIRNLLTEGKIQTAQKLLGRAYSINGYVVRGSGRGTGLGFPTANIELKKLNKLIPSNGVYFTKILLSGITHFGICNIGIRPTFHEKHITIEIHVLDLDGENLYGKEIVVIFLEKMRDERKFQSIEKLKEQITLDKSKGKQKIKQYNMTNGG